MQKIRESIERLPFVALLLLVIFLDGIIGGLYRAAGRSVLSKVIGWVMVTAFAASVISFVSLPASVAWIARIISFVCWIADVVSVSVKRSITFLAD